MFYDHSRSPAHPPGVPASQALSRYQQEEMLEAETMKRFRAQDKRDELVKLTENSFFDSRMKPLAGRPVLLAAGVKTWDGKHSETDESPNVVKFEILQGEGTLEFFTDYIPGRPMPGLPKSQLQTLAMEGYEAFVWLVTNPGSRDEVVVKASLAPAGMRAAFIDPKSEVLFHVHPVGMGPADKKWDIRKIRARTYLNDSKPHAEAADNFIFTYPSSIGVFKLDSTASLYRAGRLRLFHKDAKGTVAEAPDWEEKRTWKMEREKWHTIPPDLRGLLTHVEEGRARLGFLTHSQYDPLYGGQGNDQFQQSRWELGEYLARDPEAGPEDLSVLRTIQEDPNSPIAVEVSRTHHTNLQRDHGMSFWGGTIHWICSIRNIWSIYDLVFKKTVFFQAGPLPSMDKLKTNLAGTPNPAAQPPVDKPIDDFLKGMGFSFQDMTPDLESRFRKLGHPPGPLVTRVEPQSIAGSWGLLPDDVVVMANWELTPSATELQRALTGETSDGKELASVSIVYWRNGSYFQKEFQREILTSKQPTPGFDSSK
jgi:hypothetical protein